MGGDNENDKVVKNEIVGLALTLRERETPLSVGRGSYHRYIIICIMFELKISFVIIRGDRSQQYKSKF